MSADAAAAAPGTPTFKGHPVPWVTKWSGERVEREGLHVVAEPGGFALAYEEPGPFDRDSLGALWLRDAPGRRGEPLFAQVHAGRHRQCMVGPRCQVCGRRLPEEEIPWLFPAGLWAAGEPERLTVTPPTCLACWSLAERLCPHLRRGGVVRVVVERRELWGVVGDLYVPVEERGVRRTEVRPRSWVAFTDRPALRLTLAKQLAVRLLGAREVGREGPGADG